SFPIFHCFSLYISILQSFPPSSEDQSSSARSSPLFQREISTLNSLGWSVHVRSGAMRFFTLIVRVFGSGLIYLAFFEPFLGINLDFETVEAV
ncbi:MAG: hypothetical protein EZS28_042450, partial [Streblomastix strix]